MKIDATTKKKITRDQVQRLASKTLIGIAATIVNAFILAMVLWQALPWRAVLFWLAISIVVALVRLGVHMRLQKNPAGPTDAVRRQWFYTTMLAVSGCLWGALSVFFLAYVPLAYQVLIALVLCGMVAGGVGAFASVMTAYHAFSLPTLIPFILVAFGMGGPFHMAMGGLACMFALFMFLSARRLNREIYEFLAMKYENIALIDRLEKENRDRTEAEAALRIRNQQIESIVAERTAELRQVNVKLRDEINERIEAEKERQSLETRLQRIEKMEVLGSMAGGVAHDLNNILSGIVSYPDLLLVQLPPDSPMRRPIEVMQRSGKKAAAIVDDLLTLTRRGVVAQEVIGLNEVVEEYLSSPEHEVLMTIHPGIDLESTLADGLPDVLGSRVHLTKTVMNLVANAAEAMPTGGTIRIVTARQFLDRAVKGYDEIKPGDYAVLSVSDTGAGIDPEDIDRIFEPFFTKKKMGRSGTGLGMAVVWGTVKDHNGYIDVASAVGQGARFSIYFPVTRQVRQIVHDELPVARYHGNGETLLVVDDVSEQRRIASDLLAQLGYRVHVADSGEAAVDWLRQRPADVVVLDMIMEPGMDGLSTYKQIIALHPGQRAVIASGFSETARVREAIALGAGPYIKKPYTWSTLGRAVQMALGKAESETA